MDEELNFLRFFYNEAAHYMGPADGEIYDEITSNYAGPVPKGYGRFEEEE